MSVPDSAQDSFIPGERDAFLDFSPCALGSKLASVFYYSVGPSTLMPVRKKRGFFDFFSFG